MTEQLKGIFFKVNYNEFYSFPGIKITKYILPFMRTCHYL